MSLPNRVLVPSKTFLCGEYAVLNGSRALMMTHEPYFSCAQSSEDNPAAIKFHPESPAGKLEMEFSGQSHMWLFEDPHSGAGGFGGSTAEFISVYKTLRPNGDLNDLMTRYFKIFESQNTPPSGADLTAQFSQAPGCFVYSKEPFMLEPLAWSFTDMSVLILKTTKKLATHEHLEGLGKTDFSTLGEASEASIEALKTSDQEAFLAAMESFANTQLALGLLSAETKETADAIGSIEGVYKARGCGAMGADVIAVFVKKESLDYVWSQIESLDKGLKRVV